MKNAVLLVSILATVVAQAAIENAKPPLVVTHSPGHMFITDILNADLNDYLESLRNA